MSFIQTPDLFWNRASTRSRQAIQKLLFPSGIPYDFETGFGTSKEIDSYLLLAKLSDKNVKNSDLVGQTDEQELGITYQKLDLVLFEYAEKGIPFNEINLPDITKAEIETVQKHVERNSFKSISPPICQLKQ
jgi:NH3-dependent NAD+ synthetase